MSSKPWLTVIMPVHNGGTFLGATLTSTAAEHPEGVEFLIYDSSDDGGTQRLAESFADRLTLTWQPAPAIKAWTAKINRGAHEAAAPHIVMLHQDDVWLPGHLSAVRKAITDFPDAAMSIGPSQFVGPDGRPLGSWHLPFSPGLRRGSDVAATLLVQNSIAIPSPAIRRQAFLDCGGMDEALWYTADWDLYLKLSERGDVAVRSEMTTAFRVHRSSLTMTGSRDLADFRRQHEIVLERHAPHIRTGSPDVERRARASIAINCAFAAAKGGRLRSLAGVAVEMLKLGPLEAARYLRQSRIIDRLVPRLRLLLARGI